MEKHPLYDAITNRLSNLNGLRGNVNRNSEFDSIKNRLTDPRSLPGILSRGNNVYPGGSNRAPVGSNRGMASGNNPGLHLGQLKERVDKRPVPALTSNNPFREAIERRLSRRPNRQSASRMNDTYGINS